MPRWLGGERIHLESCGSTNDEAFAQARAGAPHGTVITAGAQTAGRGRAGRSWHSPAGANLYLSAILRVGAPPALAPGARDFVAGPAPARAWPAITLAAGIGVCEAVRAAGVPKARLKWPNDVLVDQKKLAGILSEAAAGVMVIGIGVDIAGGFPPELAAIATSIRAEAGAAPSVSAFADALLAHLEPWLDRFLAGGVPAIARAWEERALLGRRVRAGTVVGIAMGLGDDGSLRIALDGGGEHAVIAGDVVEFRGP